jgi:hypothetical protein
MLSHDTVYLEVAELSFAPIVGPSLIGSRDALLIEWRARLGMDLAGN